MTSLITMEKSTMRLPTMALVGCFVLSSFLDAAPALEKSDKEKIKGSWEVDSLEVGGVKRVPRTFQA